MSYNSNPFAENGASTNPYSGYEPSALKQSPQSSAPTWVGNEDGKPSSFSRDLDAREEALRRREQELYRREQELDNRERMLRELGTNVNPRVRNWPRWPKSFVYQNINQDIQVEGLKPLVRNAFIAWHVTCFLMVWNLVAMTGALAVDNAIGDFVLAIVYFFIWLPISFLFYRSLYNASRKRSGLKFFFFFFFNGFQSLVYIFWGFGIKGSGMAGLLWMIDLFNLHTTSTRIVGIFCLIGMVFWWLMAAFNIYLWIHVRVEYSRLGGNRQARQELGAAAVTTAANNPDAIAKAGQYAASNAARA